MQHDWALRFEDWAQDFFRRMGFAPESAPLFSPQRTPDFLVRAPGTWTIAIEAKLYRTSIIPFQVVFPAIQSLEDYRRAAGATRAIFVTPCRVLRAPPELLAGDASIVIYDYDALIHLAAAEPDLMQRLEAIVREAVVLPETILRSRGRQVDLDKLDQQPTKHPLLLSTARISRRGTQLLEAIARVPAGRDHFSEFEQAMRNAVRYVFDKDIVGWVPTSSEEKQKLTERGLSRFDLIGRISSAHDFWESIERLFGTRYVVFEFKNFAAKIGQGQIYTTEKYLFGTALRRLAIIISREGASKNAEIAARGALREAGKLIVNLTTADVSEMLRLKDVDEDYNAPLIAKVDDMLMWIER